VPLWLKIDGGFRPFVSFDFGFMEMLYLVPQKQTLNESSLIMENLVSLRPKIVQALLENCNSIKVKRLFMLLKKRDRQKAP